MASASNFRTSLRRHNVIYTRATFSRTKASAKWPVTAATLSSVTSCKQIRAQFRLFQVKAMFKQHVNLMIWTRILRLQTASRNELPCKMFNLLKFSPAAWQRVLTPPEVHIKRWTPQTRVWIVNIRMHIFQLHIITHTVNSESFANILISWIALKDIFATLNIRD